MHTYTPPCVCSLTHIAQESGLLSWHIQHKILLCSKCCRPLSPFSRTNGEDETNCNFSSPCGDRRVFYRHLLGRIVKARRHYISLAFERVGYVSHDGCSHCAFVFKIHRLTLGGWTGARSIFEIRSINFEVVEWIHGSLTRYKLLALKQLNGRNMAVCHTTGVVVCKCVYACLFLRYGKC